MDIAKIDKMLVQIRTAIQTQETLRKKSGRGFNIFTVLHTEHDEVRITRVLSELLDPNGCHAQGAVFLRQFVECVLIPYIKNATFTDADYECATVVREYSIANRRRIDLFLTIGKCRIPIEVKIYAGDQQNQCQDYYKYAVGAPMFYLTLDGRDPEQYSTGALKGDEVQAISFKTDILRWLESCLCQPSIVPLAPIREILLQLIDVIRNLTGQVEDSMQAEIEKVICANGETLFGAMQISKILPTIKPKLSNKIFEEIDKRITEKYKLQRHRKSYDYVKDLYASGYVSIGYLLGNVTNEVALALTVEIDYKESGTLCVGIAVYKHVEDADITIVDTLRNIVIEGIWRQDSKSWPIYQIVRYDGNKNDIPDFKNLNQACCDLIEPDKRKAFIDDCMVLVDVIADGLRSPYKIEKR